ncbi:DUF721 domain-containing protein [Pistricoccus aurantiacus]|uniref:DUF721 domain-containing protein n=1 Tax=Pistricoccus aurantiacus TaxID=1883414 RepID=UPI0036296BAA
MSIKVKRFRAQPVTRLLEGRGDLGDLIRQTRLIDCAQQTLREALPEDVREHVFVGGYRDGRLTLITDRAVWLTWLRYEQARLLEALHRLPQFRAVLGFNFKVRPVRPLKIAPRQTRHFSPQAASEIASCAEDTSDPRLKRALERLAAHGKHQTS